ncbi:MAG: heat-inducible transcriptional repressor HrcA [Clostridia bacterium]
MVEEYRLSERKKKILDAVITSSNKSDEPISSKLIQEKFMPETSSATIRNELMSLEEMGYLYQPHASAGRVPTPEGYRYYIDNIMNITKLSKKDTEDIKVVFKEKLTDIEKIVQQTAKVISDKTNYASFAYMGVFEDASIDVIRIVKLSDDMAFVVVKTDVGLIKDISLKDLGDVSEEQLMASSKYLTNIFAGKNISELHDYTDKINLEFENYRILFDMIVEVVEKRNKNIEKRMAIEGTSNLFDYHEFEDMAKARNALSIIGQKETLLPLLADGNNLEVTIKVGNSKDTELKDCSLVTATYKINGKKVGTAGVVGPVRMDYKKVVEVLNTVTKTLNENLTNESNENKNK